MESKKVNKPWGYEIWMADGKSQPYAFKQISLIENFKTSLQVHEFKHETNYVVSGIGIFLKSQKAIRKKDIETFKNKSKEIFYEHEYPLESFDLIPGQFIEVPPLFIHRVIAKTNLLLIECSTNELDDVIRLQDDFERGNGKIPTEHSN